MTSRASRPVIYLGCARGLCDADVFLDLYKGLIASLLDVCGPPAFESRASSATLAACAMDAMDATSATFPPAPPCRRRSRHCTPARACAAAHARGSAPLPLPKSTLADSNGPLVRADLSGPIIRVALRPFTIERHSAVYPSHHPGHHPSHLSESFIRVIFPGLGSESFIE